MTHSPGQKSKTTQRAGRRIIGLMAGTSADGLDLAVVDINRHPGGGRGGGGGYRVIAAETKAYPSALRRRILQMMEAESVGWEELVRLHYRWAAFAAECVHGFCKGNKVPLQSIDALASHGQTLAHYPRKRRFAGGPTRGTFQVGDPAVLARLTGCLTVGDFRWSDIAAGGEGAPLSGYYHYLLLARLEKKQKGRTTPPLAVLNIGGMANISVARFVRGKLVITAFDTGPGNCLSDAAMQLWGKRVFDRDGRLAARGKTDRLKLEQMRKHSYFRRRPPKSCGKEEFGLAFLRRFYPRPPRESQVLANRLATVNELVAGVITDSLPWLGRIGGVVLVGGGRHNQFLRERIGELIAPAPLISAESLGLPGDHLEAIGFALLANETLSRRPGNPGGATGAQPAILGKICLPG